MQPTSPLGSPAKAGGGVRCHRGSWVAWGPVGSLGRKRWWLRSAGPVCAPRVQACCGGVLALLREWRLVTPTLCRTAPTGTCVTELLTDVCMSATFPFRPLPGNSLFFLGMSASFSR